MKTVSAILAVLGLGIGAAILALDILIVIFFTLIFTRSQDGPVIWERLGLFIFCLALPGIFLVVIGIAYLRDKNLQDEAEEDYDEEYDDGQSTETEA